MFHLNNVSKKYSRRGNEVIAFHVPALTISQGSYVAIVGPSGSGKTTMLSMLGGMLTPSNGQVTLDGTSLYGLSVAERAKLRGNKVGFVFQTFNLVPFLTAVENVQVPLYLKGLAPAEQRRRAIEMLGRVGLGDRIDHKPCELSTGQQQRVALARTLANDPSIVLADEPTGNLDPESRACVLDFLDGLHREGRTIVMVTHDMKAAERSSRVIGLAAGRIVEPHSGRLAAAA